MISTDFWLWSKADNSELCGDEISQVNSSTTGRGLGNHQRLYRSLSRVPSHVFLFAFDKYILNYMSQCSDSILPMMTILLVYQML